MRHSMVGLLVAVVVFFSSGAVAQRYPASGGKPMVAAAPPHNWVTPASSVARPEDTGIRAHTNWVFATANGQIAKTTTAAGGAGPLATLGTHFETPASMACVYKIPGSNGNTPGCVPNFYGTGGPQSGGWGAIAVVDAYDNPYAATELATFDTHFGLPAANFFQVYANGNGSCTTPAPDPGWGLEESLDIEWAHAMSPKATIILVEACSNSLSDLVYAEYIAGLWVSFYGGGDVTNSWGGGEFPGETANDPYFGLYFPFNQVYFASAGDSGCGASYPASSPWLVAAGGTTIYRKTSNLSFSLEGCWGGSGGGFSSQENYTTGFTGGNAGPWANYQYPVFGQFNRATPDLSFNADPNSGVVVYDCALAGGTCYYFQVGGTSVSSPALAGIVNNAENKLGSVTVNGTTGYGYYTAEENNLLYSQMGTAKAFTANFYDVSVGSNGCSVGGGWDFCTGVGSPRGLLGK